MGILMDDVVPFPTPQHLLLALAKLPADTPPESWPRECMVPGAHIAAALITERVDMLPDAVADPMIAWRLLPGEIKALVFERNTAMAAFCAKGCHGELPDHQ